MAKSYLAERGVKYTEYDVAANHDAAKEMIQLSGQMGVPVISINSEVIVGFNRARIDQLLAQSDSSQVSLGISIADAAKVITIPGNKAGQGAYVGSVKPGSLGEKLGLRSGDTILKLAAMPVAGASDIERLMTTLKRGDRLTVLYVRDGEESTGETVI
jgi:glutaredoxin 3